MKIVINYEYYGHTSIELEVPDNATEDEVEKLVIEKAPNQLNGSDLELTVSEVFKVDDKGENHDWLMFNY